MHAGVCGCDPTELCVFAGEKGTCAKDDGCDPFDCTCFTERGYDDPCPDGMACSMANWPLVTCQSGPRP